MSHNIGFIGSQYSLKDILVRATTGKKYEQFKSDTKIAGWMGAMCSFTLISSGVNPIGACIAGATMMCLAGVAGFWDLVKQANKKLLKEANKKRAYIDNKEQEDQLAMAVVGTRQPGK